MPVIFWALGGLGLGSALGFGVNQSIDKALTAFIVIALLYFAFKKGVFS